MVPDARGLAVPRGRFHIDPWRAVDLAVVTHAHSDHARPGSRHYICSASCAPLLRARLGPEASIEPVAFGERRRLGEALVSLHPAGHVLGSAQVRVEMDGQVWVVTGDYKRQPDPSCEPFELVPCDTLITEATFALPIYRWPEPRSVAAEILRWWELCAAEGRCAILCCYALGKAQRILAELARITDREVHLHGSITPLVELYREAGVRLLPTRPAAELDGRGSGLGGRGAGALVLAPPSAAGTPWAGRLAEPEVGFASGWMRLRGVRRRRAVDRGFVLSDHVDWQALLATIAESGARRVLTTHGHGATLVRLLRERGLEADELRGIEGRWGEGGEEEAPAPAPTTPTSAAPEVEA